ncbi:hypothetical protein PRIPAC_75636 [Pristionchus pacificus]|nr:hypothetical protein PRIPAC_75636 [Pristionchus pacificus]
MLATVESLCSMDCRKVEKTFLLGDTIYVQTVDSYHLLHAIDRTTFSIEEVSMHYHDIAWHDLYVTAAIQVHDGIAYKWTARGMAAGKREPDGVHWRIVETTGPVPPNGNFLSTGVQDGDTTARYFMLMQEAMADDRPESLALYVYELNLTTTEWQRSILIDAKDLESNNGRYFSDAKLYLVATSTKLHVFSKSGIADSVVIDRVTRRCSLIKFKSSIANPSFAPSFVLHDKLLTMVFERNGDDIILILYRFHEETDEWKNWSTPMPCGIRCALKLMFMFVINLNPSLFDWALTAIRRCDAVWQQASSVLPQTMLTQVCRRVSSGDAVAAWPGFRKDQVHFKNDQWNFTYKNENGRKRRHSEDFEGSHSLKTAGGNYLRAWQGPSGHRDLYADLAPHCRSCEKWTIEVQRGGKVVLKSIHHYFLSAHRNGRVGLVEKAGATELWEPIQNDDGSWSLKSAHGAWLSYFQGDGVICTMPRNGKTEQFWLGSW